MDKGPPAKQPSEYCRDSTSIPLLHSIIIIAVIITPAVKYPKVVIPAKAGIQKKHLMPDQARHDGVGYLAARLITPDQCVTAIFPIRNILSTNSIRVTEIGLQKDKTSCLKKRSNS